MSYPAPGDIVISRSSESPGTYEVRIEPGPPQLIMSERPLAIRRACDFALRKAVDAWWVDDGSFQRLVHHRAGV